MATPCALKPNLQHTLLMSSNNPFSLRNKVIIQFGGTGLLGRALVSALGAAEATVVVASRNRASLDELLANEQEAGHTVHIEEVDISSEASLQGLRDRVVTQHGRVDGIVFNAVTRAMTEGYSDDISTWAASMKTNATGFFATMRVFGDLMARQGSGSIVNIGSIMGMVGMNPWLYGENGKLPPPDYFFHKGGMVNLTRYLASYYGPNGVRANVISPGGILNPENPLSAQFLERYGNMTMLGRMAHASEIGGATVFLLSDASVYITGVNLPVDGGYTAK